MPFSGFNSDDGTAPTVLRPEQRILPLNTPTAVGWKNDSTSDGNGSVDVCPPATRNTSLPCAYTKASRGSTKEEFVTVECLNQTLAYVVRRELTGCHASRTKYDVWWVMGAGCSTPFCW